MNLDELATLLTQQNVTLATAESCTGGLVGHLITNRPGSSTWYVGGAVTYSNELKMGVLGVKAETLEQVGAVSAEVALQMAQGAKHAFDSTYAISVTGIAGPGGGSAEKPVGLTYIGVAGPAGAVVRRFVWQGSREGNKLNSAHAALELLKEVVKGEVDMTQTSSPSPAPVVEVRVLENGGVLPVSFQWQGSTRKIINYGRQWQVGFVAHYLVMTSPSESWELQFHRAAQRWQIKPLTDGRRLA